VTEELWHHKLVLLELYNLVLILTQNILMTFLQHCFYNLTVYSVEQEFEFYRI